MPWRFFIVVSEVVVVVVVDVVLVVVEVGEIVVVEVGEVAVVAVIVKVVFVAEEEFNSSVCEDVDDWRSVKPTTRQTTFWSQRKISFHNQEQWQS